MVERWGDAALRASARSILDKVERVLPPSEQPKLRATALFAMSSPVPEATLKNLGCLRRATNEQRKVTFSYTDQKAQVSKRAVRPLGLYFWGGVWTLGAYCELRLGFRNFRLDRIVRLRILSERFELVPPVTLEDFVRAMTADA